MNLLFIEGGSRVIYDTEGNIYLGPNLHRTVLERYRRYCDNLTLLMRRDEKVYTPSEAEATANKLDKTLANVVTMPDLYRPARNFFSLKVRKEIKDRTALEVQKADRVVIRISGNMYAFTAIDMCRKYSKPYMIEAVEFIFEMRWYHSLQGKLFAPYYELRGRKYIARAPYVVYVARDTMTKRYPTAGKTLDCSNVELQELDDEIPEHRLERVGHEGKIIFGTAAFLNSGVKGQRYVIRAIAELRKKGVTNIEYRLAGGGSPDKLLSLAESLGVMDAVKVYGSLPHDKIFSWYDGLDVYIQPSFQEGFDSCPA